jgi:hypothetical protein
LRAPFLQFATQHALFCEISDMTRISALSGGKRVPNNHQGQLKIWGRANSVNVQKVLWCLAELDLAYQRIDAGMAFGRNNEPGYLAMNPNGRVPTLVDGDLVLWESNAIMRYLALAYAPASPIYPAAPKQRAGVDSWLDWTLSTIQPVDRRSRRTSTRRLCNGASSMHSSQPGASSKAMTLPSPTLRSAPMLGAGWGSRASPSRGLRISTAGLRNSAAGLASSNLSRRRCRD